ncbi:MULTISPECIES: exopolysaccharide biosynthesis polyprenyl glycosylphosphotransferase [unclassified Brevundimonas]|uniref:exopolysaccharide biosynthesis polyprenyl glycosylphosphotransferase n=1 Tax=unclassified Brevundimonas TaxID=2622653 RepID=UPI0025C6AA3C|nr:MULTISPECIES: exopolysaccharide biosynthesis polyprenyl glycosylphosphotransferase [unclassified Brevundimonas]
MGVYSYKDRAQSARLEAVTEGANESAKADAKPSRHRRGPFRPLSWTNARQRAAYRLRVFYYRGIDLALTATLTLGWVTYPGGIHQIGQITLAQFAPYALGWTVAMWFMLASSLYSFTSPRGIVRHALVAALCAGSGAIAGIPLQLVVETADIGRFSGWAIALAGCILVLHTIWAAAISRGRRTGALIPNVVLVGATRSAERMVQAALNRRDVNIIGIFDDRNDRVPEGIAGVPVLGTTDELLAHHLTPYLDCIVLAVPAEASERLRILERRLSSLPNRIATLIQSADPSNSEIGAALDKLSATPVAALRRRAHPELSAFYKRLQDVLIGGIALLALSPLLLLIGLWIKLDSRGPALFKQERHGFNQERIVVWKFRTMRIDRMDRSGAQQVTHDDDRITRAGRFLRVTSLDELPQLLNVLRGEMSLVGPRPHAISMRTGNVVSSQIVAEYAHRHRIKPGLTGWAAINGSRGPMHTAEEVRRRVQLDIDYIERQSFWLDVWIMLRTLPVLLGDKLAVR